MTDVQMPARRWGDADRELAEWPAPEIACREAIESEIPRGARAIAILAAACDWTVRVTYARGTWEIVEPVKRPTEKSRPRVLGPRVVDSIAVRMMRGLRRAVGVWHDGRFHCGYRWTLGAQPIACNVTGLREWLTDVSGRPTSQARSDVPAGSTSGEIERLTGADLPAIPTELGSEAA